MGDSVCTRKLKLHKALLIGLGLLGVGYYLLIKPGHAHDSIYWVYRIGAMADEMKLHGMLGFPYRILSTSYEQYGYGAPLFYGDFFLIIPAVLVVIGLSPFMSLMIHSAVLWCVRIWIAYFSGKKFCDTCELDGNKGKELASVFALLYCSFPYMLEVMIRRGSIGETTASMFLPLFVAYLWRLMNLSKEKIAFYDVFGLSIGIFGIVISHVITTYLLVLGTVLFIICNIRKLLCEKWRIKKLAESVGIAIGLLAYWLFSFVEQFVLGYLPEIEDKFVKNGLSVKKWFVPSEAEFAYHKLVLKDTNMHDWYPSMFFYILIIATAVWWLYRKNYHKSVRNSLLVTWIITVTISCKPFLYLLRNVIGMVQFPWRLMSFVSLLLAFILTYEWNSVSAVGKSAKQVKRIVVVAYVISAVLSAGINMVNEVVTPWKLPYSAETHYREELYIPVGADTSTSVMRGETILCSDENAMIDFDRKKDGSIEINYSGKARNAILELPLFYYKGYNAVGQDGEQYQVSMSKNGLVQVEMKEIVNDFITVNYNGTVTQFIGCMVSILSIVLVAINFWRVLKERDER